MINAGAVWQPFTSTTLNSSPVCSHKWVKTLSKVNSSKATVHRQWAYTRKSGPKRAAATGITTWPFWSPYAMGSTRSLTEANRSCKRSSMTSWPKTRARVRSSTSVSSGAGWHELIRKNWKKCSQGSCRSISKMCPSVDLLYHEILLYYQSMHQKRQNIRPSPASLLPKSNRKYVPTP